MLTLLSTLTQRHWRRTRFQQKTLHRLLVLHRRLQRSRCITAADVAGSFNINGQYKQVSEAVSALEIDLSTGNYFTKTISGNSTFTFANPPASGTVGSFTLELTHSSGTVTWPSSVKFNSDTAPTLTTGKTHLFFFVTDDGGTRYRGAALVDYVN